MMINRTLALLFGLIVVAVGFTFAQESVTLTTPVVRTSTATYVLDTLLIDLGQSRIVVTLKANNGELATKQYDSTTSPTAASLLTTLNTSNNSTTSLIKRVYNRLIADGFILGTVSGTPQ